MKLNYIVTLHYSYIVKYVLCFILCVYVNILEIIIQKRFHYWFYYCKLFQYTTGEDYDSDSDMPVVYSTEYETADNNKKSDDDDQLDENGYYPTPNFF